MREMSRQSVFSVAFAAAMATLLSPTESYAQGAALEEVVVTARKRQESLQDMGMSISAIGGDEVQASFARDISQLANMAPNLIIDDTSQGPGGVAAISVRGIGVAEVESSFDPAVGVVVDGLFLGKASGSITKLLDIERIEVLRGPQGTLFGRNSIGGVINVVRSDPTGELGGKVRASYGNFNTFEVDGMLNFGVTEDFAVKLTASRHDRGTGYFRNITTGSRDGEEEYLMGGIQTLWTPTENLRVKYSFMREEYDQDTPPLLNVAQPGQLFCDAFGFCSPSLNRPITGNRYQVAQNGPNEASFDANTHIFSTTWDLNENLALDYIFGYRKTKEEVLQDFDGTPLTLFETSRPETFKQTSHELRLTGTQDRLKYTVGAYFFDMEYTIDLVSFIGFVVPDLVLDIPQTANQQTDSWAVFFEADYNITDDLVFTLGGRYTDDVKKAQITNDAFISQPRPVRESWSEFNPKVGLTYSLSDESMVYALYSQGYRAGGFNGRPQTQEAADLPYDPETVTNIEVGFKTELLGRTLRLNGSLFRMEYDDKQEEQSVAVAQGTGQQTVVANAASATIWGAELDFLYLPPVDGLTFRGNVGWLDAEYDDFIADIGRGGITDNSDLRFRRAPKWNGSLTGNYEWQAGAGMASVRGTWRYLGKHAMTLANSPQTNNASQNLVDASLNYQINNLTFSVFGRNLLKEDGYMVGFDVGGVSEGSLWTYAAPRPPRTYGFQVMMDF